MAKKPTRTFLEAELKAAKAVIEDMLREGGPKDERLQRFQQRVTELITEVESGKQQIAKLQAEAVPFVDAIANLKKRLEDAEKRMRDAEHKVNMAMQVEQDTLRQLAHAEGKVDNLEGKIDGLERAIEIMVRLIKAKQ